MTIVEFAKGHGTENDFVVLFDPDGRLDLTVEQVARIADQHRGLGADGVLRVVRSTLVPEADKSAEWFMDYRNADGSIVEMCGNGVRVFARYLQEQGLASTAGLDVSTRAGVKYTAFNSDGSITVDMGAPQVLGESVTQVQGKSVRGLGVSMGNPHLAIDLGLAGLRVAELELGTEPPYDRAFFADGVNQEFYQDAEPLEGSDLHVLMRVHERGVGETRSCGTGVCAVAVAALARDGQDAGVVVVDVPGGRLSTDVTPDRVLLTGPAVIVARGQLSV